MHEIKNFYALIFTKVINNYFQNNCTHIIPVAKARDIIVLMVRPSPIKYQVKNVNDAIPIEKPKNLPGQSSPS